MYKTITGIAASAKKADDNYAAIFDVFSYVTNSLLHDQELPSSNINGGNDRRLLKIISKTSSEEQHPIQLAALVTLTIDISGYISNSVVKVILV